MKSREEMIKFVVRFAQLDLTNLREGDRLNLVDDIETLVTNQDPVNPTPSIACGTDFFNPTSLEVDTDWKSLEELTEFQKNCLQALNRIPQQPGVCRFREKDRIEWGYTWDGDGPVPTFFGRPQTMFFLKVFWLLSGEGAKRIKRCDECNAFFYREHAAMRCCSKRCAGRNYMRYYQEQKREKAAGSKVNSSKRRRGRPRLNPDAKPRVVTRTTKQKPQ